MRQVLGRSKASKADNVVAYFGFAEKHKKCLTQQMPKN